MKTLTVEISEEEYAALLLLKKMKGGPLSLIMDLYEAWKNNKRSVSRVRRCLKKGSLLLKEQERSVCFRRAVAFAINSRQGLRERTIWDFRYICRRLMQRNPHLSHRVVSSLGTQECEVLLRNAYPSEHQFRKARSVLSCVFTSAMNAGWCQENPVKRIPIPKLKEKTIYPLTHEEIERLWHAARKPEHAAMQLSLYLMLYCGLRPNEVCRMSINDIDMVQGCVRVQGHCSKTGGGRVVPLRKLGLLRKIPMCIPSCWISRWRALRVSAGFSEWQRDVCRHTFASYHAAYFRNLAELQWEMGHGDLYLLRSRYLYPAGVIRPEEYWRDC